MLVADFAVRRGTSRIIAAFSVPAGTILGLIGPSGAGKTTVLETIAGLVALDEGTIALDGLELASTRRHLPPEARSVALVRQRPALFPHLDVRANVGFSPRARRRDVEELLERFDLSELASRYPRELSGGQAQRVAIARALAARSRVLLLDEPLTGLDAQLQTEVLDAVREAATDRPVVLVEHDVATVLRTCDLVAVLEAGRQRQLATPAQLQRAPADATVAGVLGLVGPLPTLRGAAWAWPATLRVVAPGEARADALVVEAKLCGPPRLVAGRTELDVLVEPVGSLRVEGPADLAPGPVLLEITAPILLEAEGVRA
jgi:molybdate transport system ATP-binding protein